MSEQELCELYGVDWQGPDAHEAVDRVERLLKYRSRDYLEQVSFRRQSPRDFDFEEERRFAEETEQWANERDFAQLAQLAGQVGAYFVSMGRFSLRVARGVEDEVMEQVRRQYDLRDWAIRLQEGDFDPVEVIDTINRIAQDDAMSGESYAEACMDGLYPFVAGLVIDAQTRFDGNLGRALAARFQCPPRGVWIYYRGVSAYLSQESVTRIEGETAQRVHIRPLAAPPQAPYWHFPPSTTQDEALALLRAEVDAFWRQNPPQEADNNNNAE